MPFSTILYNRFKYRGDKMEKDKYVTTIYLDKDIEKKLKELCKIENRNINNLIGYLILKSYESTVNKI